MRVFHAVIFAAVGAFGGPIAAQVAVDQVENSVVFRTAMADIENGLTHTIRFLDDARRR